MRKMITIIAVSLFISTQLSCAKSYKNIDRTLTGQIVDSVTNDPIINTSFVLDTYDLGGSNRGDTHNKFSFATDGEGHFSVTFNYKDGGGYILKIQYPNGGFVWEGSMSGKTNLDAGIIKAYKQ